MVFGIDYHLTIDRLSIERVFILHTHACGLYFLGRVKG